MWSYHEQLISKMLRSDTRYHTVSPATRVFIIPPTVGVAEYCGERVCLSVRQDISGTTNPIFTKFLKHATCRRGSVLLWRRSDKLCISCFINDVIFARKPRLLDVAPN